MYKIISSAQNILGDIMESVWQKNTEIGEFPTLNKDIKTDVLIIGGGIAGILAAYMLHQKGVPYILAEKERIAHGTTAGTTAKITYQHGLIYSKILKDYGLTKAQMYLAANKNAFDELVRLCEQIDCEYETRDNFVYSRDDYEKIEQELKALEKIGYNADFTDRIGVPIDIVGAVSFKNQAQFNPLKFLGAVSRDLNIYENTKIRELIGTTAYTDKYRIYAKKIIVATHFPFINKHGSYFLKLYQHRSYMLALKGVDDIKGMYVDCGKTGYTFRNYRDLLLLGGGDHRTGKKGGGWDEVRQFARVHYPFAKEVGHWAAQDCMSLDDIPYIGKYSKNTDDLYVVSGFNKWGITSAHAAATILTDMILGRQNDFAEVFSPSRSILKPQLLVNGFETTVNLITPTPKRCPHLGCALKRNKSEHSWDCPCHGSRFTSDGRVLENPATGDLNL